MMPKLVALQSWKKLQVLAKKNFRKKNPASLFVQIRPRKRCGNFFLNKLVSTYFNFADEQLLVPKSCSSP